MKNSINLNCKNLNNGKLPEVKVMVLGPLENVSVSSKQIQAIYTQAEFALQGYEIEVNMSGEIFNQ